MFIYNNVQLFSNYGKFYIISNISTCIFLRDVVSRKIVNIEKQVKVQRVFGFYALVEGGCLVPTGYERCVNNR